MKSIVKSVVLIVIGTFFAFPILINANFSSFGVTTPEIMEVDIESNLNNADFWDFTGSSIFIDDSDPNYNWAKTASENDWCNGNGSLSNPYTIENITIDPTGSSLDCGILISNSQAKFFTIRNITVHSDDYGVAGIKLEYTNKGTLINNKCSKISRGISLLHSNNNTISGNTLNENFYGIYLGNSSNNIISGNIVNDNDYGIRLSDNSNNNIIMGNNASDLIYVAPHHGIELSKSHNNTISGNILNDYYYGIYLSWSQNNTVVNNTMIECGLILLGPIKEFHSHNIDATNLVNGKPLYYYIDEVGLDSSNFTNAGQVILVNCTDSLLTNLNISNGAGISLYYCNNNNISVNTVNDNTRGISLRYSNNNTISGNDLDENSRGIELSYSHDNTISGNAVNNRYYGIHISDSDHSNISGNVVNNGENGIYLSHGDHNTISNNTASNNREYGICLTWSQCNVISGNIANLSDDYGIWLYGCDASTVSENIINNNRVGMVIGNSDANTISNNTANNNSDSGIHLYMHSNGNSILNNIVNYNGDFGIYLSHSDYNNISGNRLFGNNGCICEDSCQGNTYSDNGDCTIIRLGDSGNLIPGYDLFFLLGVLSVAFILTYKRVKKS